MKGKRRVENKAETSRNDGEGKEDMMVLKLDGEWGQGELISGALPLDEFPTEAAIKPVLGLENWSRDGKARDEGRHCSPAAAPQAAQRAFPWP